MPSPKFRSAPSRSRTCLRKPLSRLRSWALGHNETAVGAGPWRLPATFSYEHWLLWAVGPNCNGLIPNVLLLIESSRAAGRAMLRGIANFSHHHGPWSFYWEPG